MSEPYNSQNLVAPSAPGIVGATLTDAAVLVFDMNGPAIQELNLNDTTHTWSASNISAGRKIDIIVRNATGSSQGFTFDSNWVFVGAKPVSIANGKAARLTLLTNGATAAKVIAQYSVQT